jgi:hypothetical protein
MNSLKRDSSRLAAAESQLAEYIAWLVMVIARLMSSFFNPHAPYVLGLINDRWEDPRGSDHTEAYN